MPLLDMIQGWNFGQQPAQQPVAPPVGMLNQGAPMEQPAMQPQGLLAQAPSQPVASGWQTSPLMQNIGSIANSGALADIGYGLLNSTNWKDATRAAGNRSLEMAPARQQEAKQEAQLNQTRAVIMQKYPDLVPYLDAGASPNAVLQMALERDNEVQTNAAETARREQLAQFITDPAAKAAYLAGEMEFGSARAGSASPDLIKVGAGETLIDPTTGLPVYTGAPDQGDAFGFEKDLYSQYSAAAPVKLYQEVKPGYERVRSSATQNTGAGDVGLVYGYMKMLDPGSVVREGEFATAESTAGLPQQVVGLYNKLVTGKRLTDQQKQQFVAAADSLYQDAAASLSSVNDQFATRAQAWQVDPSRFLTQPATFEPLTFGGSADPLGIR